MNVMPVIILASASRSRASMLRNAGLEVQVRTSKVDEAAIKEELQARGVAADAIATALAIAKAKAVSENAPKAWVIGADQILVCDGKMYDKPADIVAAKTQLQALSGKKHDLLTATVVVREGKTSWQHLSVPHLLMRRLSDSEIEAYLANIGSLALESVGAYQLEGRGAMLFDEIDGDFFTILGLPLLPLLAFLRSNNLLAD